MVSIGPFETQADSVVLLLRDPRAQAPGSDESMFSVGGPFETQADSVVLLLRDPGSSQSDP